MTVVFMWLQALLESALNPNRNRLALKPRSLVQRLLACPPGAVVPASFAQQRGDLQSVGIELHDMTGGRRRGTTNCRSLAQQDGAACLSLGNRRRRQPDLLKATTPS
jgi:hypothetical protein